MLSGFLITLDLFVCIALVIVVLLQRSEGGAFGMSSGPTGLVTARGAGDLLTRTTWVLFTAFIALSLGLSLLGAHNHATSSLIEKLKFQKVNPGEISQPLSAPQPEGAPGAAGVAQPPAPAAAAPAATARPRARRQLSVPPPDTFEAPAPAPASPPTLLPPPPKPDDTAPPSQQP
jgi:preprotein translocase subunit SecG